MDSHHQKLTNYNTQRNEKYVVFSERKVQRKENYFAGYSLYLTLSTKNKKWISKLLCSMYVIFKSFVETNLLFLKIFIEREITLSKNEYICIK